MPTLEVFGESEAWTDKYGHKGILHRHMRDLSIPAVIEAIDVPKAALPKGYQCSNVTHLLDAYTLLTAETHSDRAVIKPIHGTAGFGIIFIDSKAELESYNFPMGEVLLEEMLNLGTSPSLALRASVSFLHCIHSSSLMTL